MAYIEYNANPAKIDTGDCVVRALSKALGYDWEKTYTDLAIEGLKNHDRPDKDYVWINYLRSHGYNRYIIPNTCPDCYTIRDFCADHPAGVYVLGTGSHVVAVINGDYYDTWDSGGEVPIFYLWRKD